MTHRVLFIAPTRIGDAVLAAALLEHIRITTPDAQVTIVASPFSAPLYSGYPLLQTLHIVDKRRMSLHWWRIWNIAITHRWDAVWDMRGSGLSYMCFTKKRHVFSSTPTPAPKHEQYRAQLGLPPLPFPILWPQQANIAEAANIIPAGEKIIVLAPCANYLPKEWPVEHFSALGHRIFGTVFKGYRPMIVCAAHERERAMPLIEALKSFRPIDATTGEFSLLTIYACFARARGFIGNDSGLMHMAAASGIPTLGLFGPTDDITYQPCGAKVAHISAPERDLRKLQPHAVVECFTRLVTNEN